MNFREFFGKMGLGEPLARSSGWLIISAFPKVIKSYGDLTQTSPRMPDLTWARQFCTVGHSSLTMGQPQRPSVLSMMPS
jgi:hypothetical protein